MNLRRSFKNAVQRVFRRFGYDIVTASRTPLLAELTRMRNALNLEPQPLPQSVQFLANATADWHLPWLLSHYGIDLVLDVGANEGQFARGLRSHGYAGHIESFEPLARCALSLRAQAAQDSHWTVHSFALGATAGESRIRSFSDSSFSSLHSPTAYAHARFGNMLAVVDEEIVRIATLNDIWPALAEAHPAAKVLLKTDTQGHDLEVLRGAGDMLDVCCAVMCECSLVPLYADAPSFTQIFEFLAARGFQCSGFYPVSYCEDRPAMIEANVFFVNRRMTLPLPAHPDPAQ